ncbi:MAG: Hpt domain-containing protein [Gammaproteobacteria bacterium]
MPLKTKPHEQFTVLVTGDTDINHLSLKHHQSIIIATKYNEILVHTETTQFDLILFDLTVNASVASVPDRLRHPQHSWQFELITHIKKPLGINNNTPVIAIINSNEKDLLKANHYSIGFEDWLIKPIIEERLNEIIDLWQMKALASAYIQIILNITKNNKRLTLTLFEKLFEELPLQIIGIEEALKNKQYDLAKEITHKLNGSASFCGLMDIQQSANAVEKCLLNKNHAIINQHFMILQQHTLNFTRLQELILANLEKC